MMLVMPFTHSMLAPVSQVGGKGCNLITLTAAGFPVPPGFVVTASAYQLFLDDVGWLNAELARFNYDQLDALRGQCEQLRARLAQHSLPVPVATAIGTALESLGVDPVAVRSSSTFEDLAQAAFAGQHDTYLNIRGADEVVQRVRDCYLSLWGDRAVLYRHRQGFTQHDARMAVVVQRQIACDRAGVGFSVNPVTGRVDRMAIDANYGLGESVVAGECEVDHFELDKSTLAVIDQVIGHKTRMIVPTPDGVAETQVSPDQADRACLDESQLRAVAELLKSVEAHYGWPQDIEWGFKAGKLYQFQSRPVTTVPPRWTRDESAERFPNPMSPLNWDFMCDAFRKSLTYSLDLMGLPPLQGDWFQRFGNHIYGNQNAVELLAAHRPLKARAVNDLVQEIPDLRRRYSWVLDLPVRWARDLDRYLLRLGRLSAVELDGADLPTLGRHMGDVLEAATEYFRPNIAISMTQAFVHRLLHALVAMAVGPDQGVAVVDGLLAGCETKTAIVNRELHELAQVAASSPALQNALSVGGGDQLWKSGSLERYPVFAARFRRFLEDHGHREMDMDSFHPTWSGRPGIVLDALGLILRGGADEDPAETARKLRQRYVETELTFLAKLPEDLRFFFRELIRLARTYTTLDDLEHYQTTRINPVARRSALAVGEKLVQLAILDAAEDVYFFQRPDLELVIQNYPAIDRDAVRAKLYAAKASYEASRHVPPAWNLDEAESTVTLTGNVLRGLPGSPGKTTGPCFRVTEPGDFARFPKGAVLVARTTNPAWTPLFYSARGLITESGGPLSHGAVTAREMRLPAVMSIRNVMSLLNDGQVVTVDGGQGLVHLD